ncbi:MAG TPA: cellulase family glycosylhydrolase, partial [Nitrososphaera sp.]|nr:cellulase family glycosylhydrolase [Nitrososphaera sp.]
FWNDYYLNKVRDPSNDCNRTLDVWTLHANFMKVMIEKVDRYPNVLGYELLNEPPVWKDEDYQNLGNMHTELAKKLRKVTDKTLIFTREIPFGKEPDGDPYQRQSNLQHKILPKDPRDNVIYAPHIYTLKNLEKQVDQWKSLQKKWESMGYDVEIAVGEWAFQPPENTEDLTQEKINEFVKVWSKEGFMHAYWVFGCSRCGEGNVLVDEDGILTDLGTFVKKSIIKHYD